jgi:hypothetical protein
VYPPIAPASRSPELFILYPLPVTIVFCGLGKGLRNHLLEGLRLK